MVKINKILIWWAGKFILQIVCGEGNPLILYLSEKRDPKNLINDAP
jgi:hypothetical protein